MIVTQLAPSTLQGFLDQWFGLSQLAHIFQQCRQLREQYQGLLSIIPSLGESFLALWHQPIAHDAQHGRVDTFQAHALHAGENVFLIAIIFCQCLVDVNGSQ